MPDYPDFICVGAQKAATTWLHGVLGRTCGIFLPPIKETNYFSQLCTDDAARFGPRHRAEQIKHARHGYRFNRVLRALGSAAADEKRAVLAQLNHLQQEQIDDDWYRGIFSFARDNEICGEICPSYFCMPTRGIRHLLSINPCVRILIIVRDPVSRAWSHMRMHIKSGHLDADLSGVVRGDTSLGPYLRYTDYAGSIPRWKSMAGEDRVRVLLYDQIVENPGAVLGEILEFVGMPGAATSANFRRKVFTGKHLAIPEEMHSMLLLALRPQYDYLQGMFPDHVSRWLQTHRAI
ncbi:MAG: sulfotransferase [Phycisphaerales bacterium]